MHNVHNLHIENSSEPTTQTRFNSKNGGAKNSLHMHNPPPHPRKLAPDHAEQHLLTAATASLIPPPPRDCSPKALPRAERQPFPYDEIAQPFSLVQPGDSWLDLTCRLTLNHDLLHHGAAAQRVTMPGKMPPMTVTSAAAASAPQTATGNRAGAGSCGSCMYISTATRR